jgi:enoyl-CoA hydratase/carnithine racemase
MADTDITHRVESGVSIITLNRPEKLNAWRIQMERELTDAMRVAATDDAVRVIVLTGAGRGFCAGADMGGLQANAEAGRANQSSGPTLEPYDSTSPSDFQFRHSFFPAVPKPIIAAVNGPCAGLGFVLAAYADIRFASERAMFTTAFSRRGLIAEHGISWLLPRLVGLANAFDLLYSARKIDAAEALRLGFVSRVFAPERFEEEVLCYARMLAAEVSPRSLREMKREIWAAQFQTLGEAIRDADADMAKSFASADFREGVAHFMERRPPAFTGA